MMILDWIMWSYFVVAPIYIILTYKKHKAMVIAKPSIRASLYTSTVIGIWVPTLVMFFYQMSNPGFAPTLIWLKSWSLTWLTLACLLFCLICYLSWSINKLRQDNTNDSNIRAGIGSVLWLLPATKQEMKRFVFAVSPSAGICEEILYRGFLLGMLNEVVHMSAAIVISSIAFATPHLYQGMIGFIKTFILGTLFAVIVIVSESLLLAIILHTVIDMYVGLMSYFILNRSTELQQPDALS